MKKANLTIIAIIIATFVFSMFAFQPTTTEASNNIEPLTNPTPKRIRAVPNSTREPIRKSKTKASNITLTAETYENSARTNGGNVRRGKTASGIVYQKIPPETVKNPKVKHPTNYKEGGINDMTFRRKPRRNGKH